MYANYLYIPNFILDIYYWLKDILLVLPVRYPILYEKLLRTIGQSRTSATKLNSVWYTGSQIRLYVTRLYTFYI